MFLQLMVTHLRIKETKIMYMLTLPEELRVCT